MSDNRYQRWNRRHPLRRARLSRSWSLSFRDSGASTAISSVKTPVSAVSVRSKHCRTRVLVSRTDSHCAIYVIETHEHVDSRPDLAGNGSHIESRQRQGAHCRADQQHLRRLPSHPGKTEVVAVTVAW